MGLEPPYERTRDRGLQGVMLYPLCPHVVLRDLRSLVLYPECPALRQGPQDARQPHMFPRQSWLATALMNAPCDVPMIVLDVQMIVRLCFAASEQPSRSACALHPKRSDVR